MDFSVGPANCGLKVNRACRVPAKGSSTEFDPVECVSKGDHFHGWTGVDVHRAIRRRPGLVVASDGREAGGPDRSVAQSNKIDRKLTAGCRRCRNFSSGRGCARSSGTPAPVPARGRSLRSETARFTGGRPALAVCRPGATHRQDRFPSQAPVATPRGRARCHRRRLLAPLPAVASTSLPRLRVGRFRSGVKGGADGLRPKLRWGAQAPRGCRARSRCAARAIVISRARPVGCLRLAPAPAGGRRRGRLRPSTPQGIARGLRSTLRGRCDPEASLRGGRFDGSARMGSAQRGPLPIRRPVGTPLSVIKS